MKWLKHYTDCVDSESLTFLIEEAGFEGYGRYWRILELIAKKMDHKECTRCHVEYPVSDWCKKLRLKRPNLFLFLGLCQDQLGFKLTSNQQQTGIKRKVIKDYLKIEVPMLLKIRDNYTKNLQAGDKQPPRNFPPDTESDTDTEKEGSSVVSTKEVKEWDDEKKSDTTLPPLPDYVYFFKGEFDKKIRENNSAIKSVNMLGPNRKELIQKLWGHFPDKKIWIEVYDKATKSNYLNSRKEGNNFLASFDWILNHFDSIHDGTYDDWETSSEDTEYDRSKLIDGEDEKTAAG